MEKSVGEDGAQVLLTKSRSLDVGSLCEDNNTVSGEVSSVGNGVSVKRKRRGSEERSEVGGQLKRRRRITKDVFLRSLKSALVGERQRSPGSAVSGVEESADNDGKLQPSDLPDDGKDLNGAANASDEKWVVKKKDKSRQVTSNSELSSHLGSGFEIPKRSRGVPLLKKKNECPPSRKGGIAILDKSGPKNLAGAPSGLHSGVLVEPISVLSVKKEKTAENDELGLSRGKKRVSAERVRNINRKDADARTILQTKCGKHIKKRNNTHLGHNIHIKKESSVIEGSNGIYKYAHEDDDDNLEQNAARMLSSRFDPRCTNHSGGRKTPSKATLKSSCSQSFDLGSTHLPSKAPSIDDANQVPRTRKHNGDTTVRKRRHFYEVYAKDVDPNWVLTRRIKVFWPLDQNWYFGLVKDYNPSTGLHNVKYDDHDEEWINLQNERFQLLLFPSEFKCKFVAENKYPAVRHKNPAGYNSNGNFRGNIMESEPIISWLARSIARVKKSPLSILRDKKESKSKKGLYTMGNVSDKISMFAKPTDAKKKAFEEPILESNSESLDRRFSFYYSRRRSLQTRGGVGNVSVKRLGDPVSSPKFSAVVDLLLELECLKPKQGIILLSSVARKILKFAHTADRYCVYNSIWCHRYDTLVFLWPKVHMEILFVDNANGLRLMSFVGCLMHAVAIMCLITSIFDMSGCCTNPTELKLPFTSIGFKLSVAQHRSAKLVFSLQFFLQHERSKWKFLERSLRDKYVTITRISPSECTYSNISKFVPGSYLLSLVAVFKEGARKGPLASAIHLEVPRKPRKSVMNILCHSKHDSSLNSYFSAKESSFFLNWHLKLLMKNGGNLVAKRSLHEAVENDVKFNEGGIHCDKSTIHENILSLDNLYTGGRGLMSATNVYVKEKQSIQGGQMSDGEVRDESVPDQLINGNVSTMQFSTSIASKTIIIDNEPNHVSPSFAHFSLASEDFLRDGSLNGFRKPRTHFSYSLNLDRHCTGSKHQNNFQSDHPCKKLRIESGKRMETTSGILQNLPLLTCEANILITEADKGRRLPGVEIVLQYGDHEWKIFLKHAGTTLYAYRAHQFMQPGITNRYTHAVMWKGGKDWTLEFIHRSQWAIFREMHEECYDRNMKAANQKIIPIPGVHLIEDSNTYDDEVRFIRSTMYVRQIGTEVDMALDPCHVLYDMDSDDEEWISNLRLAYGSNKRELPDELEDIFEREIDILEKSSYSQKSGDFSDAEIGSFLTDVGPLDVMKSIYEYWRTKRRKKQMPLIRQFQPPLWEWYQRQLKEWEVAANGSREKGPVVEKPSMFAFCLKPRGLGVSNKVPSKFSKQRSHKKISVSVNSSLHAREHDGLPTLGRNSNGFFSGSERTYDSPSHYHSSTGFSPRNFTNAAMFNRDSPRSSGLTNTRLGGISHLKIPRSNSMRTVPLSSSEREFRMTPTSHNRNTRRSLSCRWNGEPHEWFGNNQEGQAADIEEFRLRDASNAAQHALNMAKLKREKARWLLHKADLALHKAVVALTTAEAMRDSEKDLSSDS